MISMFSVLGCMVQATEINGNSFVRLDQLTLPRNQGYSTRLFVNRNSFEKSGMAIVNPQNIPPVSTKSNSKPRRGITLKFALITFAIIAGATIVIAVVGGKK